jgi:hypothetical protein
MQHRVLVSLIVAAVLTGCASIREARMAVPPSLSGVSEESFGKVGWGRKGEFVLGGQAVRYERGADRVSLFDSLSVGRAPLRFTLATPAGDSHADCRAQQAELNVGGFSGAVKPWTLTCRWSGASSAKLNIGEARSPTVRQAREGAYQRGELTLGLRSVHKLEGRGLMLQQAVGYEILREGQVIGSVDLSRGVPHLRRPDPRTPLGQAVTEAALALALVWEPN